MARQVIPGPINPELLFLHEEHRVKNLFDKPNEVHKPLVVRKKDREFWEHILDDGIPEGVMELIQTAGFGGIFDCGHHKIDHALITALVERWRPETHTFHLPFGEVTVTLQDVQVLWGLNVDGFAVTGLDPQLSVAQMQSACRDLLGIDPTEDLFRKSSILLSALMDGITEPLPDVPTPADLLRRARLYILHMIGGTLFPDKSGCSVPLIFLVNLLDLPTSGKLSWGSAVLACLYRNLCKAAKYTATDVAGPMMLLQLWAWERIRPLAPELIDPEYDYDRPYGARWCCSHSFAHITSHGLEAARYTLSLLRVNEVNN